ncbi:hypothetical protein COCNU_03G015320 [Cocos nucifera]|uniref:Uncharacterized protein n=1 Tax=Cocos nucifera TaxID=13894 RepID=A0A8K0MZD7_COCNU|nr:hypothetical protein COCNU_03G015320 [Cocos nucifera]
MKFSCRRFHRKVGRAHGLHPRADGPELFELATKEAPIEGRKEALLPKGSATMPPSTLLELKFSPKLRTSCQEQKDYDLPQTSTIEISTASTIATTATILRNVFSSDTKLRSSSERDGWANSQPEVGEDRPRAAVTRNDEVGRLTASSTLPRGGAWCIDDSSSPGDKAKKGLLQIEKASMRYRRSSGPGLAAQENPEEQRPHDPETGMCCQ